MLEYRNIGRYVLFIVLMVCSLWLNARIELPSLVGDNMVLQQETEIKLWGWGLPGEEILINVGWSEDTFEAVVDKDNKWEVRIKTPIASFTPYEIHLEGMNKIILHNILIGEVWLASGQSNMYFPVGKHGDSWQNGVVNYKEEIKNSNYPEIRIFTVRKDVSNEPEKDVHGEWQIASPITTPDFSAVSYFFARDLFRQLKIPIGIISSSWGGTPAESWMSEETLGENMDLRDILRGNASKMRGYFNRMIKYYDALDTTSDQQEARQNKIKKPSKSSRNKYPVVLYNAMIHPLVDYSIRGVIWYQGESNAKRAHQYRTLFPALIKSWRDDWKDSELPFYFVQIAPHHSQNPEIREAQLMTLKTTKNTGMVVTTDIGDPENIHPRDKQTVGRRLSLWALAQSYGKKEVVYSGPIYDRFEIENDNSIRIYFKYAKEGLKIKGGGKLNSFLIAGKDKKFYKAEASIDGSTIVVKSAQVNNPVAVRFGWSDSPEPNLFNKLDLPASPFRTDNWRRNNENFK